MTDRAAQHEAARHVREWAGEQLRRLSIGAYGQELGTVRCEWQTTGIGFPQTVGEFNEPVEPAITPEHYELILVLPATAHRLAEELPDRLREAMTSDGTLDDRVHIAEIPSGVIEPEDGENEDYEGSVRIRIPVTVFVGP
jgi:hypothetical protein